jgi:hypothetical protein
MPVSFGLLLIGLAVAAALTLDGYVSRHRNRCTEMLGMMVGMVAGMTTGLVIGEVAGFFTDMFWGNLLALLLAVPFAGYLGRHGHVFGILDGAMAGLMGGMMGAMLGVMLRYPPEYALFTGIVLVAVQSLSLGSVAYLVRRTCALPGSLPNYYQGLGVTPQATSREIAAAYLALTEPTASASPEQLRFADEALRVLSDPFHRMAYDRARTAATAAGGPATPTAEASAPDGTFARPNSWGTLALIGLAIVAFNQIANQPLTCPPPAVAAGLPALSEPGDSSKQVVNLTIQYPCYSPDRITLQRGVPVELHVGTVGNPECGRQLVLRGLGVNTLVTPGQIKTLEFTPEKAGTYSINCGMNMMRSAMLVVTE